LVKLELTLLFDVGISGNMSGCQGYMSGENKTCIRCGHSGEREKSRVKIGNTELLFNLKNERNKKCLKSY